MIRSALHCAASVIAVSALLCTHPVEGEETFVLESIRREGTVKTVGELSASREVLLDTQVPGIVTHLHVGIGDRVEKGDRLVTLDNIDLRQQVISMKNQYDRLVFGFSQFRPFSKQEQNAQTNSLLLAVEQARIRRDFDKREYIRMDALFREKSVPESRYDDAKKRYLLSQKGLQRTENRVEERIVSIHALKREIAIMREKVSMLIVRAPFSGTVAETFVEAGGKVGAGPEGNLVHLTDPSHLVFRGGVPEEYYAAVGKGNTMRLEIPGRGSPERLNVARVSPAVDTRARSFIVEADVPNKDLSLKPGLFCTGYISIIREGLAVPGDFVEREEDGDFVTLEKGNRVRVSLISSPERNEVFISGAGIKEGTVIIK